MDTIPPAIVIGIEFVEYALEVQASPNDPLAAPSRSAVDQNWNRQEQHRLLIGHPAVGGYAGTMRHGKNRPRPQGSSASAQTHAARRQSQAKAAKVVFKVPHRATKPDQHDPSFSRGRAPPIGNSPAASREFGIRQEARIHLRHFPFMLWF